MITTVYIIRHGMTVNAEERRYAGHLDISLSQEGERQMKRLADHLLGETKKNRRPADADGLFDVVYCSDLQRTRKSAEIVAEPFGLQPVVVPAFRERGFGRWEGMTFDEIKTIHPREFDAWVNDPHAFSPVGGESTEAVRDRVMPAFYDAIGKNREKQIAIVAHGGVNRIIICELLGIPLQNLFKIEQDFSALNIFVFYDENPVLKLMNYSVPAG